MNVLIVGGGGREHALAWKLSRSARVTKVYAAPGSAAIAEVAECVALADSAAIVDFARAHEIGLTVVGPEAPLVEGLADALRDAGLRVFGPSAAAARLEGSKAFAKAFMERHGIPTAPHRTFDDVDTARAYVAGTDGPYVVKADGLAAGKGVLICHTRDEADAALRSILTERAFGDAGTQVVIEGFLRGEEASYFAICDGMDFVGCPSAQDHKPVGNLDRGLNTGGMGAYCPAPVVTTEVERRIVEEVVRPTLAGMAAEGHPYQGVLYVGLMISPDGRVDVVEYNCRFGDPECQPLLMLLESDLLDLLEAAVDGQVTRARPAWRPGAAACIVMASGGYPGETDTGHPITGLDTVQQDDDCRVFHAGTARRDGNWVNVGGRVLGVTAWGPDLPSALGTGYRAVSAIHWKGAHYREDIGLKGLKRDRGDRPQTNVAIIVGSASDLDVAKKATDVLEQLNLGYEVAVASAHRTPERVHKFIHAAEDAGAEVFIAMAGMAAALPGVVAAVTQRPVIGVPVLGSAFQGLDALLSIAQMPPGIPVATVAVGGGANAALLAASILAVKYPDVAAALKEYRLEQVLKVEQAHRDAGLSKLV